MPQNVFPYTPLRVSPLSCELILSRRICCHEVFIFAHGGFVDDLRMGDNVAMKLLDDVGESRCTRFYY